MTQDRRPDDGLSAITPRWLPPTRLRISMGAALPLCRCEGGEGGRPVGHSACKALGWIEPIRACRPRKWPPQFRRARHVITFLYNWALRCLIAVPHKIARPPSIDRLTSGSTSLAKFRAESSLATWLTRITLNEAMGRLRRRRPTVDVSTLDLPTGDGAQVIPFRP